jgi:hypothetical protein
MWSKVLRTICQCSVIWLIGVPAQVHVSAAADDVPQCTQRVQDDIAALCAGSLSGLIRQPSGAEALLCMPAPEAWNGDLILFARGNTRFPENDCKLASITGQLKFGETSLPGLTNQLGFGFATSTCSEDVLAVGECKDDLVELATNFQDYLDTLGSQSGVDYGSFVGRKFLTGASMGGLVATQLIEEDAGLVLAGTQASVDQFDGALAACGPIGNFRRLVRYQGDLLVLTDCLYSDELETLAPDGLVSVDEELKPVVPAAILDALNDGLCPALEAMIDAAPEKAAKLLRVMAATGRPVALDPSGAHTVGEIIADVLCSDILPAIPVSEARFGGNPYDNMTRIYFDPLSSLTANRRLNRCVDRFAADADTEAFETLGQPAVPLVTLHTLLDPRVPFSQNLLYARKVLSNGQVGNYTPIPSPNFGHCSFSKEEVLAALAVLVIKVSGFDLLDGEAMLEDAGALDRFHELVEQFRNDLPQGGGAIDEAIEEAASAASDIEDDIDDSIPDIPKF